MLHSYGIILLSCIYSALDLDKILTVIYSTSLGHLNADV